MPGRKGIPNKRSIEAREKLDAIGFDPLMAMVELALDPASPVELRGRLAIALAEYCYPKLRGIECSGAADPVIVVNLLAEDAQL